MEQGPPRGGGLIFGITAAVLRRLVENPWNGGGGHTPAEVGAMTPDQIYFCLCDPAMLSADADGRRTKKVSAANMVGRPLRARTASGGVVQGRVTGQSVASRLAQAAALRRQEAAAQEAAARRKRRGR